MTESVVLVGPSSIRGPGRVDDDAVSVALDAIDDRFAVHDDRVVGVQHVWIDVMRAALGGERRRAVIVVPSWWSSARVAVVEDAARESCSRITVLLRGCDERTSTVIELGPDIVVVHAVAGTRTVLGVGPATVGAVSAAVAAPAPVVIQVPDGAPGCVALAAELARVLGRRGLVVTSVCDDELRRTVPAAGGETYRWSERFALGGRRGAILVGALSVVATLVAAAALSPSAVRDEDTTWVVEGRVAVEVPAQWTVERLTSGPGSARVQVVSHGEPLTAVHLTQAGVRLEETLGDTAAVLQSAFFAQPRDAFVDFDAAAVYAGRSVVSYRERRTLLAVDWVAWVDQGVRIAVGCQHALDRAGPDAICERAVASAHTVS